MHFLGTLIAASAITIAWVAVMPSGSPVWRSIVGWIMIWASIDFYAHCRYKY